MNEKKLNSPQVIAARYWADQRLVELHYSSGWVLRFAPGEARLTRAIPEPAWSGMALTQDGAGLAFDAIDTVISIVGLVADLVPVDVARAALEWGRQSPTKSNEGRMSEPQEQAKLNDLYAAWLDSPQPWSQVERKVAPATVRREILRVRAAATESYNTVWQEALAVWKTSPESIKVWSDLHLFHKNILQYTPRPFDQVQTMNQRLLENAWSTVSPDDWLLFLGDVSLGPLPMTQAWLNECPGRKVLLVGNHDVDRKNRDPFKLGFAALTDCLAWPVQPAAMTADGCPITMLWLTHYPLWDDQVPSHVLNVHGHIHEKILPGRRLNVSVEHLEYAPKRLIDLVRGHRSLAFAPVESAALSLDASEEADDVEKNQLETRHVEPV